MASISPDSLIGKVSTMSPNGVQDVPSLYTPHKGEGKVVGLRPAQRTHVSANTPLKGGAACAASAMNWLRASSAKWPF